MTDPEHPEEAQADPKGGFATFLAELRRRKLGPFLIGYTAIAWVLLQLGEIVMPAFGLGDGALRVLVISIALAFPPAAALAWLFDLTRDGFKRTVTVAQGSALPRAALAAASLVVAGGAGLWLNANGLLSGTGSESADPAPLVAYDPAEPISSVAVLPLRDNSEDASLGYLGAGMQDELIMHLGQLDGLRVVSRSSVDRYAFDTASAPQIGRDLGVEALIEGSVNRSDTLLRAMLRLVHAPSDTQLDAFTVDTVGMDPLSFQTFVAEVAALRVDLTLKGVGEAELALAETPPAQPGGRPWSRRWITDTAARIDPAAAELYLLGMDAFQSEEAGGWERAREHFAEALRHDSSFAPAIAGLAATRLSAALGDGVIDSAEAEAAFGQASRALDVDPGIPEVREVFALVSRATGNRSGSWPRLAEAGAVNAPVTADAGGLEGLEIDALAFDTTLVEGVTGLGRTLANRIAILGGEDPGPAASTGVAARPGAVDRPGGQRGRDRRVREALWLMGSGDLGGAADRLREVVDAADGGPPEAWSLLVNVLASAGDAARVADAFAEWGTSGASNAPDDSTVGALVQALSAEGMPAYWEWRIARLMEGGGGPEGTGGARRMELARAHAGAGDREQALRFLRQGFERREPEVFTILRDPVWDALRRDEEFMEIAHLVRELWYSRTISRDPEAVNRDSARINRDSAGINRDMGVVNRGPGPAGERHFPRPGRTSGVAFL